MNAENLFDRLFRSERSAHAAVLYEHRVITYAELREATVWTAEALHALGIAHGDRVGILLNDSPEFIASFVAIISLGAIAVPINMALRKAEQLFILKDCGARAAIVEAQAAADLFGDEGAKGWELEHLLIVRRKDDDFLHLPAVNVQEFQD